LRLPHQIPVRTSLPNAPHFPSISSSIVRHRCIWREVTAMKFSVTQFFPSSYCFSPTNADEWGGGGILVLYKMALTITARWCNKHACTLRKWQKKKSSHFLHIGKWISLPTSAMLASGVLPATCLTEDIPYVQGRQSQSLITEPLPTIL
jgi:hypothetical protein